MKMDKCEIVNLNTKSWNLEVRVSYKSNVGQEITPRAFSREALKD